MDCKHLPMLVIQSMAQRVYLDERYLCLASSLILFVFIRSQCIGLSSNHESQQIIHSFKLSMGIITKTIGQDSSFHSNLSSPKGNYSSCPTNQCEINELKHKKQYRSAGSINTCMTQARSSGMIPNLFSLHRPRSANWRQDSIIDYCSFKSDLHTSFEIPTSCNQSQSSTQCSFRVSYWYHQLVCLINTIVPMIVQLNSLLKLCQIYYNVLKFNYTTLRDELWPLLASSSPIKNTDLSCFDSDENIRQCGLVTRPGICQGAQRLRRNSRTNRGCNNNLYGNDKSVAAYDFGNFGSFEIRCNRSLCSGPLIFQTVKELLFKYSITKTVGGKLSQGIAIHYRSYSSF
ncbi:unnamed protein product [Adineta ricciae]|uniref:Uncharacterized protein n=1 Tax=Adineta ricciae TaxID=249248 RepID=A0A814PM05_ADIRI|nr:unnamed protein product [Adineta ricciae]